MTSKYKISQQFENPKAAGISRYSKMHPGPTGPPNSPGLRIKTGFGRSQTWAVES